MNAKVEIPVLHRFGLIDEIPNRHGASSIQDVAISPDGTLLAASFQALNQINIYDARTRELYAPFIIPLQNWIAAWHLYVTWRGLYFCLKLRFESCRR